MPVGVVRPSDRPVCRHHAASKSIHTCIRIASLVALMLVSLAGTAGAATLRGRVLDPDDRPVPYARVNVRGALGTVLTATCDADGRFLIEDLAAGPYELLGLRDGFRGDPSPVVLAASETVDIDVRLSIGAVTEAVIVSASSTDVPLSRVASSVTTFSAADLESRQIDQLSEALRLVPGLSVNRSGGRGALASMFPRGGESDFTLVLVDGVRLNTFGGGFDFSQLTAGDIDRVEVVRGPQSALYGADAIGAVVQVVSRHAGPTRGLASLELGSRTMARGVATAAGTRGGWAWGATAERNGSNGDNGRSTATGETISNDDGRGAGIGARGSWHRGPLTSVRADLRWTKDERGNPGPYGSDPGGTFGGVDTISRGTNTSRLASVSGAWGVSPGARVRGEVAYTDADSDFLSPYGRSLSGTTRWTSRLQADVSPRNDLQASAGLEWLQERVKDSFIVDAAVVPTPVGRRVAGLFGELRYQPSMRFVVTGGLRVESLRRDALPADPNLAARPLLPAETTTSPNPKLSLAYFVEPAGGRVWAKLHGSAGTGIRSPTALEIAFTDNPDLRPERSRSADAGLETGLAAGRLILDATAFVNRYDDLIVAVGRSQRDASRYRTDNISNARARGLEMSAAIRPHAGLDVRFAYTWMDTEILAVDGQSGEAPSPFAPGQPLLRRPRHQGSVDVTGSRGRLSGYVRLISRGRVLDVDPSYGTFGGLYEAEGYAVAHAGVRLALTRVLDVFGRVDNLFDGAYEEALGYPALGRTAYVGVSIASRR